MYRYSPPILAADLDEIILVAEPLSLAAMLVDQVGAMESLSLAVRRVIVMVVDASRWIATAGGLQKNRSSDVCSVQTAADCAVDAAAAAAAAAAPGPGSAPP